MSLRILTMSGAVGRRSLCVVLCLLGVSLLPALLSACGGSPAAAVTCHTGDVKVALSEYKFTPDHLTLPAGRTTFCLHDTGSMTHDLVIGNAAGTQSISQSPTLQPGQVVRWTATLTAGNHVIWCSLPGHRAAGMVGDITVT